MNRVVLIGRLTKDPELSYIPQSGKAVSAFNLAVNRPYDKDKADFFRIKGFGKTADNCARYLSKGSLVGVEGRLFNNNYEKSDGTMHYGTEVIADRVEFLDSKKKKKTLDNGTELPEGFQVLDDDDDEIPF